MADDGAVERELFEVGRRLAAALPTTRNPLKALDDKAMDLASSDAELKAALFRFVDVVPACRNLDDLARHLTGVPRRGRRAAAAVGVAMRMGNSKAGRRALGMAAAAGVKHMAHRFIVGEDPKAALGDLRDLWKDGVASSVDLLGEATVRARVSHGHRFIVGEDPKAALGVLQGPVEGRRGLDRSTCSARRPSRRPRPSATPTAAPTRWTRSSAAARRWPARPQLERDSRGRAAAREPVGEGVAR